MVDGVLASEAVAALSAELRGLHGVGAMTLNCTHLVKDNATQLLQKGHIYEAELSLDPRVRQAAPLFGQLDDDRSLATMLSLLLPQLRLDSQAIKLQLNAGACWGQGGTWPYGGRGRAGTG